MSRDEPRREAGLQDVDVLSIPTERRPQVLPEVSLTRGCRELIKRESGKRVGSMWQSRGLEGVFLFCFYLHHDGETGKEFTDYS